MEDSNTEVIDRMVDGWDGADNAVEEELDENGQPLSALRANIKTKGSNAYYYAHGMKIDGPKWDGKEEPRLLEVVTLPNSAAAQRKIETLTDYAWMDGKSEVKIYLDYENAAEVSDEDISVVTERTSVRFTIRKGDKDLVLFLDSLQDSIDSARYSKKSSKFIIYLKKSLETTWYQLKKSKN
jgi:hypothetical protein